MSNIGDSTLPCFTLVVTSNQLLSTVYVFTLHKLLKIGATYRPYQFQQYSIFPLPEYPIKFFSGHGQTPSPNHQCPNIFVKFIVLFTYHFQCKNQVHCRSSRPKTAYFRLVLLNNPESSRIFVTGIIRAIYCSCSLFYRP
ncbi:UNVERIFIED_CONTAM: hypothetical protein RMT77_004558 [Armadillidium vulgare]